MKSCLIIVSILLPITFGLQCYTGNSVIRGKDVGTNAKTCDEGESCLFATIDGISPLVKLKHAGCSKTRCGFIGRNNCKDVKIGTIQASGCCCDSGDFCEVPQEKKGLLDKIKDKAGIAKDIFNGIFGGKE